MKLAIYFPIVVGLLAVFSAARSAGAALPTVEQALKLTPIQRGVDFTQPSAAERGKCKIAARKIGSGVGWIVDIIKS